MKKINLVVLTAMQLIIPVLAFALDGQSGMWPGMMGWGHSMGWPMMIFMFLFWALVLAGIVALIRTVFSGGGREGQHHPESPLDILKKRYASGEISREEFEEKKQVINE